MKEHEYIPLSSGRTLTIGRTTFIINSYADSGAEKTAEQLIMQMLKSKVTDNDTIFKEESA